MGIPHVQVMLLLIKYQLGTIPFSGNPKDGVVNENSLNQETKQQEKEGEKIPTKLGPINEEVVLTSSPISMLESLPCASPMKVNAHDGEGKKVAKKEKMVADGSKVSDNTFKMEIDSLKSFKKRKSQWLKHFQKEF